MSETTTFPKPSPGAPPPPATGPGGAAGPGTASRVIAILVIAVGALIAIGTVISAAWNTVSAGADRTSTRTVAVDGVDRLEVEVDAGSLRVRYGDVSEATLEATGPQGAEAWTFERRDADLLVSQPDRPFGGLGWFSDGEDAVLTLPARIEASRLGGDFHLAAGSLEIAGRFGDLDIEVGAGAAEVAATARSFHLDLSAGSADLDLAEVAEAEFVISAGDVEATITGRVPTRTAIDVSAGDLDLTLPDGTYDVRGDSPSAISLLDDGLDTSSASPNVVDVKVSAGQVTLQQAR